MYKVIYTEEAKKAIDKLSFKYKCQIKNAVERITQDPKIGKHLTHELADLMSYRSGDYRIIYRIYHKEVLVLIMTLGHRGDIYKRTSRKFR